MSSSRLKRNIGMGAAVSVIAGSIIGSGVFMKPASMAAQTASPIWLAAVWIVAGLFSLAGALIYAEVAAMLPETGGQYVFFRKMYGDFIAFLYGWAGFAVINTASVAAISFVCAQYADFFLHLPKLAPAAAHAVVWHIPLLGNLYPLDNLGVKGLAIVLVIGLTWINYFSVRAGSSLQVLFTVIKVAVIVMLIGGIFFSGRGQAQHLVTALHPKHGLALLSGLVAAMTGAFMAYDGWVNVTFIGGEIRHPQKIIPRSLLLGVSSCIVIYILVNEAYLYALPVEQVAASPLVAADAITAVSGKTSGAIVAALIVICTFGAVNGNIMATTRVTYAMSCDRLFFSWVGKEHPRFNTPGNALWLHGIWTCVLIVSGSFDMLADMFTFISWVAYLLGAIGIFILRRKMPGVHRPYKVWGYPVVPVLFIAFAFFYVVSTVWNDISSYCRDEVAVVNSVLGLVITAAGIPLYWLFRKKS